MARYEHLPIYKQALDAAVHSSVEQAPNQFLPGDAEVGRHIGQDARKSPDLQRIVRRDRHMVLRS